MALVLDQHQLSDDDFDAAEQLIVDMVLGAVKVPASFDRRALPEAGAAE